MPYSKEELAEFRKKDRKAHEKGGARVDMSQVPVTQKRPGYGQPRPQPAEVAPTPVGFKMKMQDSSLPMRYYESHRAAASEACCKELSNLHLQYYKTSPDLKDPDMVVIECAACGRKHRRGAQGASRVGV